MTCNHKRRRCNHQGSLIKRKDGRWQASVMLKSKRLYFYSYNKKDCLNWLLEMQVKIREGVSLANGKLRLIDWIARYIELYCKPYVRSSTLANYSCYGSKHLIRYAIAEMSIEGISVDDAQAFVNELSGDKGRLDGKGILSTKTVRSIVLFLTAAMEQAQANGYVRTNVFDVVKLPKLKSSKRAFLAEHEVKRLLKEGTGHPYSIGLEILAESGLRIGELLALRHSSLTECNGIVCLDITHSLKREHNPNAKGNAPHTILHLADTKTECSEAKVPITPDLYEKLTAHIERQKELVNLGVYQNDPFIICSDTGGFIDPGTFHAFMRKIVANAGLPKNITPHSLRHYAASNLIRKGASVTATARILRHAQSSTTLNVYSEESLQGAYDAILLTRKSPDPKEAF